MAFISDWQICSHNIIFYSSNDILNFHIFYRSMTLKSTHSAMTIVNIIIMMNYNLLSIDHDYGLSFFIQLMDFETSLM